MLFVVCGLYFNLMDLLQETRELCSLYHIKPTRSRGQNFLINETVYEQIVKTADLNKNDTVLEVGPGLGFLTFLLAERVKSVLAVELDQKLATILPTRLQSQGIKNVQVVQANILDFQNSKFNLPTCLAGRQAGEAGIKGSYKIVANLPYNITSIFLRKFLSGNFKPTSLTLMLQKEVAQRLVAGPGEMSLLALSVQFFVEAKIIAPVSRNDFWPVPAVDSAIIKLQVLNHKFQVDEKKFFRLARIGFSSKRKMLKNNLANGLKITATETQDLLVRAELNPLTRAEDLSLADWVKLLGLAKQFMV